MVNKKNNIYRLVLNITIKFKRQVSDAIF